MMSDLLYDYYLFDLDNCLLHIPHPREYFDNILRETLEKLSTNNSKPNRKERDLFWTSGEKYLDLLEKWGTKDSANFWKSFDEIDFKHRKNLLRNGEIYLYDDVITVLDQIKNLNKKMGLISNTADYIVNFFLKKFKLSYYFQETLGLDNEKDQSMAKPSPNGILHILKSLKYNPKHSKAIMIGDSHVDIFAAKRAKITACLLKRDENKYLNKENWESLPDYEIRTLNELLKISK